jgi:hypothetical protein
MPNFNKMICKRHSNRCAILTRHDAVGTAHDDAESIIRQLAIAAVGR